MKADEKECEQYLAAWDAYKAGELDVERITWLVTHHHTYTNVEGMDYQILLEADFLVNAGESEYSKQAIENFCRKVFRTEAGTHLLKSMFLEKE